MNKTVSQKDWFTNYLLYIFWLNPWLPFCPDYPAMSSVKWIKDSQLIKLNVKLLWRGSKKSRDVCSSKEITGNTIWKQSIYRIKDFLLSCSVVTSPIRPIFLTTNEKTTDQYEHTSLPIVTSHHTFVCGSLHYSSIHIVYISMFNITSVFLQMFGLFRKCALFCIKDRWLIHIVPSRVNWCDTFKLIVWVKSFPIFLCVFI